MSGAKQCARCRTRQYLVTYDRKRRAYVCMSLLHCDVRRESQKGGAK